MTGIGQKIAGDLVGEAGPARVRMLIHHRSRKAAVGCGADSLARWLRLRLLSTLQPGQDNNTPSATSRLHTPPPVQQRQVTRPRPHSCSALHVICCLPHVCPPAAGLVSRPLTFVSGCFFFLPISGDPLQPCCHRRHDARRSRQETQTQQ